MTFPEQMDLLVDALNDVESKWHPSFGDPPDLHRVQWKDRGRKFAAIDVGTSGAWLVEKATGEIYNIKGYGVPDYNKKQKANIGNIATVDAQAMHARRWNYLR